MILNAIIWNVDPEIFRLGSFAVRWYGLLFAAGFVFGYIIMGRIFKIEKIKPAEPKPFIMVKDEIKKQILKQKESQAFLEMAAKLEKKADIKISKKVLNSIE